MINKNKILWKSETHPGFRTRGGNLRDTKQQTNDRMTDWAGRESRTTKLCCETNRWLSCWLKPSPIPFFYVNEGVKQLCDLWGSRGKQFDALFLRCCCGFDAKSRIQSKSKGKLTVRHWRKVVCSLLWIVLSNTSNCLDETQDVSKWLYVHGSTMRMGGYLDNLFRETYEAPEEMHHSILIGLAASGGLQGRGGRVTPERPLWGSTEVKLMFTRYGTRRSKAAVRSNRSHIKMHQVL